MMSPAATTPMKGPPTSAHLVGPWTVLLAGIAAVVAGVWIGFIGWEEYRDSPQGVGRYQVTYPGEGVTLLIVGSVLTFAGVFWRLRPDRVVHGPPDHDVFFGPSSGGTHRSGPNFRWKGPR